MLRLESLLVVNFFINGYALRFKKAFFSKFKLKRVNRIDFTRYMKKRWIIISGVVLLAGGGWWYWRQSSSTPLYDTVIVSRGDVQDIVSASVSLVSSEEINLNFELSGRIKNIFVKMGQKVVVGDVIAVLESETLDQEIEKAEASLDRARADTSVNDDSLREARETEKDAKAYYELVESAEDQKVDAADKAYENAVDYENDAESYYDQVVVEEGASSALAKSAKMTLTSATNSRKVAEEAKETARKNRDSAVRYAKNSWNASRETVKTLESLAKDTIETSAIRIAKANYDIALANAEKGKMKSPVNGMVTKVNYRKGEIIGSSVSSPFGRLLSYDFILEAKVPESDIVKVNLGQVAHVTFDSLDTQEIFPAEVIEVEPDSTVIQDVVYYKVKLRMNDPDRRLKPGMGGDVDIQIAEKKNVIEIPSRLLVEEEGELFVEVLLSDETIEKRKGKKGLEGDEGVVEIVSGLSEGERIVSERKGVVE